MTKMTIVTNAHGAIIASVEGHVSEPTRHREYGITATLRPLHGQKFHEVVVPEDYLKLDPGALHAALAQHVTK